jgi:hypothetical protein
MWGLILILAKQLLTTRWGIYVLLGAIITCGSAFGGWHYRGLVAESDQLEAVTEAIKEYEVQAIKDDRFIREVEVIKTVIVEKEIEVYRDAVKTDLCIDNRPSPDFRVLYSRAVAIANAETASSVDDTATAVRRFLPPVGDDEVVSIISENMIKAGAIRRNYIWLQEWVDGNFSE